MPRSDGATSFIRCRCCGTRSGGRAKFCSECGTDLRPAKAAGSGSDADLHQLTVLFCDLVDSTSMAARLEPELWKEVLTDYHRAVSTAVARFGGYVARVVGDGMLVYFGWPASHEDDGERAIRSALGILAAIDRLNRTGHHGGRPPLGVRIAAHSGMTLVNSAGEAFGETPHLAARVQGEVAVDTCVVTEALHDATAALFEFEDVGPHELKGLDRPVRLFRVVRPVAAERNVAVSPGRRRSGLLGRVRELDTLHAHWAEARAGHGGLVTLVGEAGIGKSRLVEEFRAALAETAPRWLEARGAPFYESEALHPVTRMLKEAMGFADGAYDASDAVRLERLLAASGISGTEALRLVAEVLELPLDRSLGASMLSPAQSRRQLLSILASWIVGTEPTIFVLEDMHWCDPSTLELLDLLAAQAASRPLLVVATCRPDGQRPLRQIDGSTFIRLTPLDEQATRALVREVAGASKLSEATLRAIVGRTDGIPLFAEEFARLASSRGPVESNEIPSSLAASVTNRLGRLGKARHIAQLCAVIGTDASYELLRLTSELPERDLRRELGRLIDADILTVDGTFPDATVRFSHALLQQVAYDSLLASQRHDLHRRVAKVLRQGYAGSVSSSPETMARHWNGAREPNLAVSAWSAAGARALRQRAFREAGESYRHALSSLMQLPETADRDAKELEIRYALFAALQIVHGYSAEELTENTNRARALTEKRGDAVKLISLATGSWAALSSAGDYAAAGRVADEIGALARRDGGPENLGHAHMVLLTARSRAGDLIGAERLFLEGEQYFKVAGFRRKPGAIAQTYGNAAKVAALLGAAHAAEQRASFALHVAAANGNPYDLAFASHMAATAAIILRKMARARDYASRSVALSDEHDYPQFAAIARVALGRAVAELEDPTAGIALMREGLEAMARTGARAALTMYLTWLAEALEFGGMSSEAMEALDQALTANPEEKLYNAEALRLRGALLVQQGDFDKGESDVREALGLATEAAALRFKIRAANSLAAIMAGRGRGADAVELLARISTEAGLGARNEDMKDALRRLAELRARMPTAPGADPPLRPDAEAGAKAPAGGRKRSRPGATGRPGRRPVTPPPEAGPAAISSSPSQPPRS